VDATAVITTGAGTVVIDITNNLPAGQVVSIGQNISGLAWVLDTTTAAGSVEASTGTFVDVGAGGAATTTSSVSDSVTDRIGWALTNTLGVYQLNGLTGSLAGPKQTILGGFDLSYPKANGSIAKNKAHNPFVQGTGHFVLSIAGATAATNISNVVFSFGATPGNSIGFASLGHSIPSFIPSLRTRIISSWTPVSLQMSAKPEPTANAAQSQT
jgi:hypothetical protein